MSWTKRELLVAAFGEIGLASYVYDLSPEQLQAALARLDSMMGTWNGQGIRLGYPLPSTPGASNLDDASNLPDSANETVFQNLATRIAPGYGKQVSPDTKTSAYNGYNAMLTASMGAPPQMQMPGTMPAGAGNKPWRNTGQPFLNPPTDPLLAGQDGQIEFD
jgi:hypothetical protein